MNSLSGLPSSGVMTRSASAKVSATMGSAARSASQHVHVLRTLSGVKERHLGRGAVTAEDALRAQRLPERRLIGRESLQRHGAFVGQVGSVGVVDGQALGRAQIGSAGGAIAGACPACGLLLHGAQALEQLRF